MQRMCRVSAHVCAFARAYQSREAPARPKEPSRTGPLARSPARLTGLWRGANKRVGLPPGQEASRAGFLARSPARRLGSCQSRTVALGSLMDSRHAAMGSWLGGHTAPRLPTRSASTHPIITTTEPPLLLLLHIISCSLRPTKRPSSLRTGWPAGGQARSPRSSPEDTVV